MTTTSSINSAPQPALETARLILRPFVIADAPDVERLAGDRAIADTTQNIPHPYPAGGAVQWIETHAGVWAAGEGAPFAMTDRDTGAVMGGIGLVINATNASAELGYWIGVPYWSLGYATEAARAVVGFGFELAMHRMHARHFTRNPASGRVMQKLGMKFEGVLRESARKWGRFEDVAVYGILDREWEGG